MINDKNTNIAIGTAAAIKASDRIPSPSTGVLRQHCCCKGMWHNAKSGTHTHTHAHRQNSLRTTRSPYVAQSECSTTRNICTIIIFLRSVHNAFNFYAKKKDEMTRTSTTLSVWYIACKCPQFVPLWWNVTEVLPKVSIIQKLLKTLPPEVNRMLSKEVHCEPLRYDATIVTYDAVAVATAFAYIVYRKLCYGSAILGNIKNVESRETKLVNHRWIIINYMLLITLTVKVVSIPRKESNKGQTLTTLSLFFLWTGPLSQLDSINTLCWINKVESLLNEGDIILFPSCWFVMYDDKHF